MLIYFDTSMIILYESICDLEYKNIVHFNINLLNYRFQLKNKEGHVTSLEIKPAFLKVLMTVNIQIYDIFQRGFCEFNANQFEYTIF